MASINLGWFGENWFSRPNNPSPSSSLPNFAFIGGRNLFFQKPKSSSEPTLTASTASPEPGMYSKMLEHYFWEEENRPDHRHTPQVEKILKGQESVFEEREDATPEEVEENRQWWEDFNSSPVVEFLRRSMEIDDKLNEMDIEANKHPFRKEDRELWDNLPLVEGPDGRPMPRRAIKTKKDASDKFWDWTKQFFFGLWGFRLRPYPPGRPIDFPQAFGYKNLEKRYFDFAMRGAAGWYYKDRLGRTRGPLQLIALKTAWSGGIIDTNTFVWGQDMDEWVPIGMVYGLEKAILSWDVRLGAAATAFLHKLQNNMSPWAPLKGLEKKTHKQLQDEAIESKKRDMAVLEANDGIWPGVRIPSHALFLWASGSQLTSLLEEDHMPNKYISKDMRNQLLKVHPGLRPWEVLSVEQAMNLITYGGKWYRDVFGTYTTGVDYIADWNSDMRAHIDTALEMNNLMLNKLKEDVPGFDDVMEMVHNRLMSKPPK